MSNFGFEPKNETFLEMFGNGKKFYVPKFQRDYSWTEENWDDFWLDIIELETANLETKKNNQDNESFHYMGYLVLEKSGEKKFQIIDGQQRITTINILILAALKAISECQNESPADIKSRSDGIRNRFIGEMDYVSLLTDRKLHLNVNNDRFYETTLVPLGDMPRRALSQSNKLLKSAFEWFYSKIKKTYATSEEIANFVSIVSDKLFFTTIYLSSGDDINAYSVFETLNARGVQLSPTDLVKNYLFSIVDGNDKYLKDVDHNWNEIIEILGTTKIPEFLRTYWNSKNKLSRKNNLFKTVKSNVKTDKQVFELLLDMRKDADTYRVFKNPAESDLDLMQRKYLQQLLLLKIKQPYSLLLACYNKFESSDFTKILKACCMLSVRYNIICGLNPNDQEIAYNKLCLSIKEGQKSRYVIDELRKLMPTDETFESQFTIKCISKGNVKIAKYILLEIERHKSHLDINCDSDMYSIEHILPQNPKDGWESFEGNTVELMSTRLGNLCLLNKKQNKDLGNAGYSEKVRVYEKSEFKTTKAIAEHYDEWTQEKIEARQREMAKAAKTIWNL